MSEQNNGGPAFPCLEATMTGIDSDGNERFDTEAHGGMTLRDYFAAKYMQGRVSDYGSCKSLKDSADTYDRSFADEVAVQSYSMADAMLKARQA